MSTVYSCNIVLTDFDAPCSPFIDLTETLAIFVRPCEQTAASVQRATAWKTQAVRMSGCIGVCCAYGDEPAESKPGPSDRHRSQKRLSSSGWQREDVLSLRRQHAKQVLFGKESKCLTNSVTSRRLFCSTSHFLAPCNGLKARSE